MSIGTCISRAVWLLAAIATCTAAVACGHDSAGARPPTATAIVLRSHATGFSGALSGGFHVSGTLYPSLPQYSAQIPANTITLRVMHGHTHVHRGWIDMTSRMIDMRMIPIHGRANWRGARFAGRLVIPMFGSFRVELALHLQGRIFRGFVVLPVLIPHR